jgi:hypothetical protein
VKQCLMPVSIRCFIYMQDDIKDAAADEEASSAAPPWTAGPAVVSSPLPYGVACGTPAALFAITPAAATEPTPAADAEPPAADAAAVKLTAALERLINVPLYAVRSCIYTWSCIPCFTDRMAFFHAGPPFASRHHVGKRPGNLSHCCPASARLHIEWHHLLWHYLSHLVSACSSRAPSAATLLSSSPRTRRVLQSAAAQLRPSWRTSRPTWRRPQVRSAALLPADKGIAWP